MNLIEATLIALVGLLAGMMFFGVFLHKKKLATTLEIAQGESKKILEEARREADRIVKSTMAEAKEESRKRRRIFEDEDKKRKVEFTKLEKKIKQREQVIESKISELEAKETKAKDLEQKLVQEEKKQLKLTAEYETAIEQNQKTLEKIANLSAEEAKKALLLSLEESARKSAKNIIRKIEDDTQKEAQKRAKEIVSLAIQRIAGEHVNDATITVVQLPSEEMKGRIIGREGRNIRAIEQATGVDLIIDDTPEAVIISCFNPVRREIAKLTLEKLLADGRIHPARIEETAKRVETEFQSTMKDIGEQAALDAGVTDLHPEILKHLGTLRFKSVGLQSVLQHCVETAHISGLIAAELGVNVKKAKRAGLLHDIGKAVNQETEGHHSDIGSDLCQKYGEVEEICEAIRQHHSEDFVQASALSVIVSASNSLSSSRPGARREVMASYVKRLEDMEILAKAHHGVSQAYVLQAGREVRALVTPDGVSDQDVRDLSRDIAMKLRKELSFPGQLRVTVLRESRHAEYAT